jgi:hypothetical protein
MARDLDLNLLVALDALRDRSRGSLGRRFPETLLRRALLEDRYVCAVGPRCRLPGPLRLDAARFAALRHVLVSPRALDRVRFASEEPLATAGGSASTRCSPVRATAATWSS